VVGVAQHLSKHPWAFPRQAVAAGEHVQLGIGQHRHRAPAKREELLIALAHHDGDRHPQLSQTIPKWLHLASADAAQRSGERLGAVAALILARERSRLRWFVGEQRLGAPALDEILEWSDFQLARELLVGLASRGALICGLDARAARHEHKAPHPLGSGERDVQRHPPAERVAAQREVFGAAGEHVRDTAGEGDRARRVGLLAVPREVERERQVAFSVERRDHTVPRAARAAESVQQDDALRHLHDPMTTTTDMYVLLRAFVDELVRCGMRDACTSPGSRNAPLVLSLAREPRVRCYSHVDERCAGFFALGLAKTSGLPVAVTCTSGTAAAELLPAAIEAREARVPLLLLTADRPAELRENGAGQAIDQLKLFGDTAKWFFEISVHDAAPARLRWMRTLACRAYWTALEGRPGAVHLNFPLREPLVSEEQLPPDDTGRADGAPYVRRAPLRCPSTAETQAAGAEQGEASALLRGLVADARRGIVVAGREERSEELPEAIAAFAAATGWPVLADPMSGARRGEAAIAHYDALLRDEQFAASLIPDLVLRVGDLPVSKPLRTWLAGLEEVTQVGLDPECAWQDPASVLAHSLALDPADALSRLAEERALSAPPPNQLERDWLASWRSADERAAEAITGVLGDELSEPAVARELGVLLPREVTLFVASSMPVREIETFWPARADPPRVLCNRGANGIDGTVSSAFGAAAHGNGPVVLLIGDVALAHDLGGLLAATRLELKLTIVLIDNDGGGIFDFLPVSRASMARDAETDGGEDLYTRHVATPTGLDFAQAATLYGLEYEAPDTLAALRVALEQALAPTAPAMIVHARTDRADNVALHRRVWEAVRQVGA